MPKVDSIPTGAPCWIDLMTSDPDASRAFYGELLGWTSEATGEEFGGYVNFSRDGSRVAGCMQKQPGNPMPDMWTVYLAVDDAEATAESARANGGQVMLEPMAVGDLGTMAVLVDAGQAGIGIWQPGEHTGFGLLAETGAPAWFELHTRDYEPALAFYEKVLGWTVRAESDTDDFRYSVYDRDGEQYAGVMDASAVLPEGAPAMWSVYFAVDDADAAVARATELGGAVVRPPEDSPYGRLAELTDSTGATFKIVAGGG